MVYRNDCYFFNAFCGDDENADCDWHEKRVGKYYDNDTCDCSNKCPYYINENIADAIIRGRIADRIANYIEY